MTKIYVLCGVGNWKCVLSAEMKRFQILIAFADFTFFYVPSVLTCLGLHVLATLVNLFGIKHITCYKRVLRIPC